jgi:hypothetical protein
MFAKPTNDETMMTMVMLIMMGHGRMYEKREKRKKNDE